MKNQLTKWVFIAAIGVSLVSTSIIANAYRCEWHNGHKVCWHNGERQCRWVNGHWHNGHYISGHKVCWFRH